MSSPRYLYLPSHPFQSIFAAFFVPFYNYVWDRLYLSLSIYPDPFLLYLLHCEDQCDQIWANFCHFGNFLNIFIAFGKINLNLLCRSFASGQIFIVANGQILSKTILVIWSHWRNDEKIFSNLLKDFFNALMLWPTLGALPTKISDSSEALFPICHYIAFFVFTSAD